MKKGLAICGLFLLITLGCSLSLKAQVNPPIEELKDLFNNQKLLITYREGEVVYGTYYFIEIHYCPDGYYGLYGNTVKRTVMGNEQKSNWQEYGQWKILNEGGVNGVFYASNSGNQQFYPVYKLANGDLFLNEGVSIVNKGQAICQ